MTFDEIDNRIKEIDKEIEDLIYERKLLSNHKIEKYLDMASSVGFNVTKLAKKMNILFDDEFKEELKKRRKQKGLTQRELARMLNVDGTMVHKWEKGVCKPRKEKLIELFAILGEF